MAESRKQFMQAEFLSGNICFLFSPYIFLIIHFVLNYDCTKQMKYQHFACLLMSFLKEMERNKTVEKQLKASSVISWSWCEVVPCLCLYFYSLLYHHKRYLEFLVCFKKCTQVVFAVHNHFSTSFFTKYLYLMLIHANKVQQIYSFYSIPVVQHSIL